ncbi:hypothetical protein OG558_37245 [Kribbella sp. NBC_01510]|uniref:hypothetical protein n=1 Tax=Kribbella sp. NBC_01510 TaxID=2903581 RepID=UPI00386902A9
MGDILRHRDIDEDFLERFVSDVAKHRPEFVAADATERIRLQRKLYRRLRYPAYDAGTKTQSAGRVSTSRMSTPSLRHAYPAYDAGTKTQSAGRVSTSRMSTPSLRHAYPAFPSAQDTAHTLLHALENLEHKVTGEPGELPPAIKDVLEQRGLESLGILAKPVVIARAARQLRDWVPLILTLLSADERRRLAANVAPEDWPLAPGAAKPERKNKETEVDLQLERHAAALEPRKRDDGRTESNYDRVPFFEDARVLASAASPHPVPAIERWVGAPGPGHVRREPADPAVRRPARVRPARRRGDAAGGQGAEAGAVRARGHGRALPPARKRAGELSVPVMEETPCR